MAGQASPLAPLNYRVFRTIWIASLASNLGGLIQSVGAAWLMTSLTSSAGLVALVAASTTLPVMIFSLASGAIADNFDRRRVIIVAQIFMLLVSVALTVCAWYGWITPWMLLGFTFLLGCGTALNNPSWQASVGDMVPRDVLSAAVTLNSVNFNITRSVGPAIGGAIVVAFGAAVAFAINTISYLALIFVIARWRPNLPKTTLPRETMGRAIFAGLRYVAMSPHIETVLFRACIFGATAIVVLSLLPLVARDLLQGDALTFGILLGCFGVGAIAGAFMTGPVRDRISTEWIVRLGFLGFAISALACAYGSSLWQTGPALMIGGVSWVSTLSLFNVTVQLSSPRWVVGRAMALYQTATFGGMALGAWIWGGMAENYGVSFAFQAAALALLVGAAIGFLFPVPAMKTLNLDPLNQWEQPNLALDLRPSSGPIFIVVEWEIKEEDLPAFMLAMDARRRMKLRDGAGQWELMRDLENPLVWHETYHAPTWVDYIRLNHRTTHDDAVIRDKLHSLHSGDGPPKVHRMIVRPTNWEAAALTAKTVVSDH